MTILRYLKHHQELRTCKENFVSFAFFVVQLSPNSPVRL